MTVNIPIEYFIAAAAVCAFLFGAIFGAYVGSSLGKD